MMLLSGKCLMPSPKVNFGMKDFGKPRIRVYSRPFVVKTTNRCWRTSSSVRFPPTDPKLHPELKTANRRE